MKILLGSIIESFTMHDVDRVIIVDADCSSTVKYGDFIEVVYPSGKSVKAQVLDGFLEEGSKFGAKSEKISAIRIKNDGFVDGNIRECKVYLA